MKKALLFFWLFVFLIFIPFSLNACHENSSKKESTTIIFTNDELNQINSDIIHANKSNLNRIEEKDNDGDIIEIYADENGTEFIYEKNTDLLIGFNRSKDDIDNSFNNNQKTKDECEIIIKLFLSQQIDFDKYSLIEQNFSDETNLYYFYYSQKVQGYRSSDFALVYIYPTGIIKSYAARNTGIFNDILIPVINEMELDNTFQHLISSQLINGKTFVEIQERVLMVKENKLYMLYGYVLKDKEDYLEKNQIEIPI